MIPVTFLETTLVRESGRILEVGADFLDTPVSKSELLLFLCCRRNNVERSGTGNTHMSDFGDSSVSKVGRGGVYEVDEKSSTTYGVIVADVLLFLFSFSDRSPTVDPWDVNIRVVMFYTNCVSLLPFVFFIL